MGINFKLPNITATNEAAQIAQIKNYLYQLIGELNYTLSTLEAGTSSEISYERTEKVNSLVKWERRIEDEISGVKGEVKLKLGRDENDKIVSMLNASADVVNLKANRLKVESDNFSLSQDGTMKAKKAVLESVNIKSASSDDENVLEIGEGLFHIKSCLYRGDDAGDSYELLRFDAHDGNTYRLSVRGAYGDSSEYQRLDLFVEKITEEG